MERIETYTKPSLPFVCFVSINIAVFFLLQHRCRRFCCFANNKVGQSNPNLDKYHVTMEKREALQQMNTESGGLYDSVYSEMPETRVNNFISFDAVAGDKHNTANATSTALYAKGNDFENPVTHDESQESNV